MNLKLDSHFFGTCKLGSKVGGVFFLEAVSDGPQWLPSKHGSQAVIFLGGGFLEMLNHGDDAERCSFHHVNLLWEVSST